MREVVTEWRTRLEPMLISNIPLAGRPPVHERTRNPGRKSNRIEEPSKMAESADDRGIPTTPRPALDNNVPPPGMNRAGPGAPGANGAGSSQQVSDGSLGTRVDRRTLIVGEGIAFTGEVNSCDRLIVEGSIQATLQRCQHVIIAETGVFNGHASTENADVRGRFDGELVVRKRLLIRAGGHVCGMITYGEIEIEAGGGVSGTIEKSGAKNADLISLSA